MKNGFAIYAPEQKPRPAWLKVVVCLLLVYFTFNTVKNVVIILLQLTPYILVLFLIAFLICLPSIIAENRKHRNKSAITALNLLFGWTGLGWMIALVWACTDNVKEERNDYN